MEEKKHKRSHEEVVAAREAYLAEKAAKKEARAKAIAERDARRAEREARKNMSPEEARADRQQKQLAKIKKRIRVERDGPEYETYRGNIEVGDFVAAVFAGGPIRGTVERISKTCAADVDQEGEEHTMQFRKGAENVVLYSIRSCDDNYVYPVRREKIIAKRM